MEEQPSKEADDNDSEKKFHDNDSEKKVEEKGEDVVVKPDVEEVKQQETEMLKTKPRPQIELEISAIEKPELEICAIEKPAAKESEEEENVVTMSDVTLENTLFEEVEDVTLENTLFEEVEDVTLENTLFEEVKDITLENTLFEEIKEDSLLDITAKIMENVLEDVWRSHQSCVEDEEASGKLLEVEGEPLPKINDTLADMWREMNRKAEEEMDRERDELIEELIVDLDDDDFEVSFAKEDNSEVIVVSEDLEDDFEGIIAREKSFEIIEEDGNANENKVEYMDVIEIDENDQTLKEQVKDVEEQNVEEGPVDVHLQCRDAGQECGTIEKADGNVYGGKRMRAFVDVVDIARLPKHPKTARLPVKVNIQNEAVENIEDVEGIKGRKKTNNKMTKATKSAILVATSKKRKVEASIGQFFTSNGNKRTKTEVDKQTNRPSTRGSKAGKAEEQKTDKQKKKRVAWTRSATKVSIGGSEEKVSF